MSAKIGINGFGRIGRDYLRYVLGSTETDLEVVAINDVTDSATLARLLKFDSRFGPLRRDVEDLGDAIAVDGHKIAVSSERDPAQLPWREHGVQIVIESTGRFRTREAAGAHLTAGASKVLLSSPGKRGRRHHRARCQRRDVRLGPSPGDLQRLVHHELCRADGEGAAR